MYLRFTFTPNVPFTRHWQMKPSKMHATLTKSGGFETGARRQIKILCRIRRKRATVSDAEQTMDVIAFATATEYVTFVSIFALLFYTNILSASQLKWITDANKLYATQAISFNRIPRDWYKRLGSIDSILLTWRLSRRSSNLVNLLF